MTFNVFSGEYPFKDLLGTVDVAEQATPEATAAHALEEAKRRWQDNPVVAPALF